MTIGNLHGLVRGAINSVNPDINGQWLVSTGNTVGPSGKSTPSYATPVPMMLQIQGVRGSDLKKYSFLQANGVYRAVYMFGNPDAINRLVQKGADLLTFPQYPAGPACTWLVSAIDEPWTSGNGNLAWTRLIVTLQLDPNNPASQA
jgi:hypothetical protein